MRDLCWRRLGRESVPSCLAVDLSPECGVALVAEVVCEFGRSASRARDNVCRDDDGPVQFADTREQEGEASSLCFSLRPLLELRMRLAPCVVLRFGAARSQGGRSSLNPARVSGIKDASAEGTARLLLKTGANAAAKAVYSGAARVELLQLLEEEAATDVRRTNASKAWRAGRRAVRSAGSAIEAIAIVVPGERM